MNLPTLPADPIVGPLPHSPEWYALRKYDPNRKTPVILGASLAGAICGQSKYTMALDVYMRYRGLMEEQIQTAAMKAGNLFEPVVLKLFAEAKGVELVYAGHGVRIPMYISRQWPWMAATPDDLALFSPIEGVDAKVTSWRRYDDSGDDEDSYGQDDTDQLPTDAIYQAQQQMAVTGLSAINFPVLFDVYTVRYYRVERNEDLIAAIVEAGEEMCERIINGDPPEANYHNPRAAKVIRELHGLTVDKQITMDEEMYKVYIEFAHAKLKESEGKKEKEQHRAKLLDMMQDAQIAVFPGGTKRIKRNVTEPTYWTADDVRKAEENLGTVKRKSHERITEAKVK